MTEKKTIRLQQDDWDCLFKSEVFELGKQIIVLKPSNLTDLAVVGQIIIDVSDKIIAAMNPEDVDRVKKDIQSQDQTSFIEIAQKIIPTIVTISENSIPMAMEILTNVDREDIKLLPTDVLISFVLAAININIGSMESLAKNLDPLIQKTTKLSQGMKGLNKTVTVKPRK